MQKHMVEEAGSRFFELATSLGRMHEKTLSGLADATAKTPMGAVFAMNASFARMANEGMETLASRLGTGMVAPAKPVKAKKKAASAKMPAPAAPKAPAEPVSHIASVSAEAIEPEVSDVLVEEVIEDTKQQLAAEDDLTLIGGIGASTARKLKDSGITTYAQIAEMNERQFTDLLASLEIRSIRFSPVKWIEEARSFVT